MVYNLNMAVKYKKAKRKKSAGDRESLYMVWGAVVAIAISIPLFILIASLNLEIDPLVIVFVEFIILAVSVRFVRFVSSLKKDKFRYKE